MDDYTGRRRTSVLIDRYRCSSGWGGEMIHQNPRCSKRFIPEHNSLISANYVRQHDAKMIFKIRASKYNYNTASRLLIIATVMLATSESSIWNNLADHPV